MLTKFWYSTNQKKWSEYIDKNFDSEFSPPKLGNTYVVINNRLLEYTECYSGQDNNYSPNYDDVEFLGFGEITCNDWNINTFLKNHPEIKLGKEEIWPEFIDA